LLRRLCAAKEPECIVRSALRAGITVACRPPLVGAGRRLVLGETAAPARCVAAWAPGP
jgi:hypothetical protein